MGLSQLHRALALPPVNAPHLCGRPDLPLRQWFTIGPTEQEPNLVCGHNDSGGAIFHGLEHGEVAERPGMSSVVERFFGTPHTVDIGALCAAHGIQHERLTSEQQLIHVLGDPTVGRRVLEVVSDRSQRPQVHAAVQNAVRATFV